MIKIKIDGVEVEVSETAAQLFQRAQAKAGLALELSAEVVGMITEVAGDRAEQSRGADVVAELFEQGGGGRRRRGGRIRRASGCRRSWGWGARA